MATSNSAAADYESETLRQYPPTPIHGDVLDTILSHLPLVHLVPASRVCKSWSRAVSCSLRRSAKPKPWLFVYTQNSRAAPHATTMHAYDPTSEIWIEIYQPSIQYVSALRSTHSNLVYMISASKLSFSFDPLHLEWHHAVGPRVCRINPVVALVGHRVVVAGGAYEFEDDPLAVEIYDLRSRTWTTCQSMPAPLAASMSSTSLSTTVNDNKLFLAEKHFIYVLDLETETWCGPNDLRLDEHESIVNSVIGFINGRLIMFGLTADNGDANAVKVWEVNSETFECEGIVGEMPAVLVEKLKGEEFQIPSIGLRLAGKFAYVYMPMGVHEVVTCEFVDGGGGCRWGSIRNAIVNDRSLITERFVLTCSEIGMDELQNAMRSESRRFIVKL